jgi:hypothetical protein
LFTIIGLESLKDVNITTDFCEKEKKRWLILFGLTAVVALAEPSAGLPKRRSLAKSLEPWRKGTGRQ